MQGLYIQGVYATKVSTNDVCMNDRVEKLGLSISFSDGIDSGPPRTQAPITHTSFLLESLSLIFPNKMVDSVLKANRERFRSLL